MYRQDHEAPFHQIGESREFTTVLEAISAGGKAMPLSGKASILWWVTNRQNVVQRIIEP